MNNKTKKNINDHGDQHKTDRSDRNNNSNGNTTITTSMPRDTTTTTTIETTTTATTTTTTTTTKNHTLTKRQKKNARTRRNRKLLPHKKKQQHKMQSKDLRRNVANHLARQLTVTLHQQEKAKHNQSTIAHVITQQQLEHMKSNGANIIHVTKPHWNHQDKNHPDRNLFWNIEKGQRLLRQQNNKSVIVVTTYDQLALERKIRFVGTYDKTPEPNDWILLCAVHQNKQNDVPFDPLFYHVPTTTMQCNSVKNNIINEQSNSHHDSRGIYFGFGSRKDLRINPNNHSSLATYVAKKGKEQLNKQLHQNIVNSMEHVRKQLHKFVGHDILKDNSTTLRVAARLAKKLRMRRDFYLQGKTGYTSLFYNIDASTLQKHTEMDWAMTTIYVPNQQWINKPHKHLQFLFHLADKPNGILNIDMKPGTIIYFHGTLLTHHQIHNHGNTSNHGCCLNFSGYANRRLLCHLLATIQRIKQINNNKNNTKK